MFMVVFNECVSSPYKYVGACPLPTRISCAFEIFNLYHVARNFPWEETVMLLDMLMMELTPNFPLVSVILRYVTELVAGSRQHLLRPG